MTTQLIDRIVTSITPQASDLIKRHALGDSPEFINLLTDRFHKAQNGIPVGAYPIKKLIKEYKG